MRYDGRRTKVAAPEPPRLEPGATLAAPPMSGAPADFYGFREPPFRMTPDARMFFPSTVHSRAWSHLLFGIAQGEGFIIVTGEVGAGKTTLVEHLCARLDPESFVVARVMTTQLSGEDMLRLLADAFGAPATGSKATVLKALTTVLQSGSKRHLLLVDEAQGLPLDALEELRMLSNLASNGRALLQTVLLGQPELRRTLASPDLDQFRQRILASYHLGGLSRDETQAYIEFRMQAVGWTGVPAWTPDAIDRVHANTDGIPRRINRLCGRILLRGALDRTNRLTGALVEETARELEADLGLSRFPEAEVVAIPKPEVTRLVRLIDALDRRLSRRRPEGSDPPDPDGRPAGGKP